MCVVPTSRSSYLKLLQPHLADPEEVTCTFFAPDAARQCIERARIALTGFRDALSSQMSGLAVYLKPHQASDLLKKLTEAERHNDVAMRHEVVIQELIIQRDESSDKQKELRRIEEELVVAEELSAALIPLRRSLEHGETVRKNDRSLLALLELIAKRQTWLNFDLGQIEKHEQSVISAPVEER